MKESENELPCCVHYASSYLPLTENWIHRIIINQKIFRPIFLSRKKKNLILFPISSLYSLDDFTKIRQLIEIILFRVLGYFLLFRKVCLQNKAQILHVHFGYHGAKMIGLKKKLNIPMVCSFYGDDAFADVHVQKGVNKYTQLFKKANKILVLGPYMKTELVKMGCPEDKIIIHHLGINPNEIIFKKRLLKQGVKVRFLIVSGFVEKKGIDVAIKALSAFKDKADFSLDIIGDGPLKNEVLTEVEKSGIEDKIKLHGYKPYSFFIGLAYECDVFIQASRTGKNNTKEGTPMAIVDAMATGMAIISTKHSDIPEIVKDGLHGYLAEENSVESLENCIQKIFDNPDKIEAFSSNGRQWVEKEFNAQIQTPKLENLYTELIKAKL